MVKGYCLQCESGYCSRTYAQGRKLRYNGQKGCFVCVQIILFVIYLQNMCARDTCRFETKALAEAENEPRRPPHD